MPARLPAVGALPAIAVAAFPVPTPAFGITPSVARVLAPALWSGRSPLPHRRPPRALPLRPVPSAHHGSSPSQPSRPSDPSPNNPNQGLANLNELTERISDLLHVGSIEETIHTATAATAATPGDTRHAHLNASTHIVVIFGKRLIRDQVSFEYAKRIVTLIKQLASGTLAPHIICFTGGRSPHGCVSEAAAGYAFFRSVCEESGVDVNAYSYLLEEKSASTAQNLQNVITALRRRCPPDAISNCHFTLVSSDYHLIRLQEVHRLTLNSPQSALFPLHLFSATWSFLFAAYPFCVSRDPATAFLGRAIVLANDLSIVLVNLNSAVSSRQFIARENLHRLRETFAKMRDMYRVIDCRSTAGFRTDMRKHSETLELAIHRVREVQTTLAPLHEDGLCVPHNDLILAQRLLMSTIRDIRESMDPDRVLLVADRAAFIEDMTSYTTGGSRRRPRPNGTSHTATRGPPAPAHPHIPPAQHRARSADTRDYASNPPPGASDTASGGNGKRIARDGPYVVVLDELAAAAPPTDDTGVVVLDECPQKPAAVSVKRAASPARRPAPRKRRPANLAQKPKAAASGRAPAPKRKTPARKRSDLA